MVLATGSHGRLTADRSKVDRPWELRQAIRPDHPVHPTIVDREHGARAVAIKDFSFQPASISVAVGSTVTWTNNDTTGHTVTADDGSFDSGTVAPGATFSHTFDTAGTFTYHCNIHPSMTATITVG